MRPIEITRKKMIARQKGQAIPIGIASIMGVTILMLALFNTSQVTSEKMRIVNTADAAAYSGMVIQARTLNFHSYTNRAMVANQVSIAQLVTLYSYSRYMRRLSTNIGTALSFIPYVGAALGNAVRTAGRWINTILDRFVRITMPIVNSMNMGISRAQQAADAFAYAATPQIVRRVVRENDVNYEVTPVIANGFQARNFNEWRGITRRYTSNMYQNRKAILARASRDNFSNRRRGWGRSNIFDIWFTFAYWQRDADTRLISQGNLRSRTRSNAQWEWKAKDTLSIWVGARWLTWRGVRSSQTEVPTGWGAAYYSTNNRDFDRSRGGCFWFWCRSAWRFRNMRAERLADGEKRRINTTPRYYGMNPYYAIRDADRRRRASRYPLVRLGVEVRKRLSQPIRTSSNINNLGSRDAYVAGSTRNGLGQGMFRVDDRFAQNSGVSAVARADVYFSRPIGVGTVFGSNRRSDRREEYANLFNPYWDVKLAEPTTERRAAWFARGLPYDLFRF